MNAIDNQPYQSQNGLANIDAINTRLDLLMRLYPDQYAVIDMSRPVSEQPIILTDGEIAHNQADLLNHESGTQRYAAVKATDLQVTK